MLEGSVSLAKTNVIICKKGKIWGEDWLLEVNKNKQIDDNIIMDEEGFVAEINFNSFF